MNNFKFVRKGSNNCFNLTKDSLLTKLNYNFMINSISKILNSSVEATDE